MRVHLKYSKNSKNNFEISKDCLKGKINILVIFETELDKSVPSIGTFQINGFFPSDRKDRDEKCRWYSALC